MPVKRRVGKERAGLTDGEWAFMLDEGRPEGFNVFRWMMWEADLHRRRPRVVHAPGIDEVWAVHKGEVLARWVRENPGTRPRNWWVWDAPEPRQEVAPGFVEGEATYLKRLGLLVLGEARRLRPADLHPQAAPEE